MSDGKPSLTNLTRRVELQDQLLAPTAGMKRRIIGLGVAARSRLGTPSRSCGRGTVWGRVWGRGHCRSGYPVLSERRSAPSAAMGPTGVLTAAVVAVRMSLALPAGRGELLMSPTPFFGGERTSRMSE